MASILQPTTQALPISENPKASTPLVRIHELPSSPDSSSSDSNSEPEPLTTSPSPSSSVSSLSPSIASKASSLSLSATHLISSPYPEPANQLRLQDLDVRNRLFALALTALRPVRDDYATAPYLESFNWGDVFALLRELSSREGYSWGGIGNDGEAEGGEHAFYVVIFRSKLAEGIDRNRLGELDQRSHEEACASGGLLKYWFGSPNGERRNLATCLWRDHADAVAGGKGPWHALARAAARTMYERIDFHVHRLIVERGAESWRLEKFVRG